MNTDPLPSEPEDFEKELEVLRGILHRNLQQLNQDDRLSKQLEFWMKSADFAVTTMEIWEDAGDQERLNEAAQRMRRVLETLQRLIERLGDEPGEGNP